MSSSAFKISKQYAWANMETLHHVNIKKIENASSDVDVFLSRAKDHNYKKAEAIIAARNDIDPFQTLKTHLSRGNFEKAESVLQSLEVLFLQDGASKNSEVLLNSARLLCYKGQWINALFTVIKALEACETSVTKLTLLQVKSVALYELKEFTSCLETLKEIEILMQLFNKSHFQGYVMALKAKIFMLNGESIKSQKTMAEFWTAFFQNPHLFNEDTLLTILRTEIDLKRMQNLPTAQMAVACFSLTEKMGDQLYSELAQLDYHLATNTLEEFNPKFERVQILLNEIKGSPTSRTAQIMRSYNPQPNQKELYSQKKEVAFPQIKPCAFIVTSQNLLFVADSNLSLKKLASEQLVLAIHTVIKDGYVNQVSKEVFFSQVWRMNYKEELHLPNIKSLLYRIKKEMGLKIGIKKGMICLTDEVILV